MLFQQVVDQENAGQNLRQMIRQGQLPHALLLYGREGTGGLPVALAATRYLLCQERTEEDSCGHCANCRKMDKLEHPDVHFTFPTINRDKKAKYNQFLSEFREVVLQRPYATAFELFQFFGAENKQGKISADTLRDMLENLSLKSYEGNFKVQIIWRPEFMGREGNIILKMLEEPPEQTIIMLVAESRHEVLPTILSRCQLINLPPLPQAAIAQALLNRHIVPDESRALQIARLAEGNYHEALQLAQHLENDLLTPMRHWFNALATNNRIQISKVAEEWHKAGRVQSRNFLAYVQSMLNQALRMQYMPNGAVLASEAEAQFLSRLASKKYKPEVYAAMSQLLNQTSRAIGQNANAKIAFHALSIRMLPLVHS